MRKILRLAVLVAAFLGVVTTLGAADYFTAGNVPSTGAALSSSVLRAEYAAIAAGFVKVAPYTGNGSKIVAINSGGTAQEAITTTGTGNGVRATSPAFTTPNIGVATATSINGNTITTGTGTLTLGAGSTLATSATNSITLTSAGATNVTLPTTGTLAILGANTFTGLQTTAATAAVAGAGFNLPHGTAPNTPANGDVWTTTAGIYVRVNGATVGPLATPTMVLLSTVTAANSATVDVETTFSSTYDAYLLVASGVVLASDNVSLYARMKIGGSYVATDYVWSLNKTISSASTFAGDSSTGTGDTTQIYIADGVGNVGGEGLDFDMTIKNPASTTLQKKVKWTGVNASATEQVSEASGVGLNTGTGALTGIRFLASAGNITSGSFRLYGIVN